MFAVLLIFFLYFSMRVEVENIRATCPVFVWLESMYKEITPILEHKPIIYHTKRMDLQVYESPKGMDAFDQEINFRVISNAVRF